MCTHSGCVWSPAQAAHTPVRWSPLFTCTTQTPPYNYILGDYCMWSKFKPGGCVYSRSLYWMRETLSEMLLPGSLQVFWTKRLIRLPSFECLVFYYLPPPLSLSLSLPPPPLCAIILSTMITQYITTPNNNRYLRALWTNSVILQFHCFPLSLSVSGCLSISLYHRAVLGITRLW